MDLTTRSQQAVSTAVRTAAERGNPATEPAHLLAALLEETDGLTKPLLQTVGVDPAVVAKSAQALIERLASASGSTVAAPQPSRSFLAVLGVAEREAKDRTDEYVSTEHLLVALAEAGGDVAAMLNQHGATADGLRAALETLRGSTRVTSPDPEATFQALEKYGIDLTARAREGRLDPVIGRDAEIRRVVQVLSRRTKNNPVLIGEPAHRGRRRAGVAARKASDRVGPRRHGGRRQVSR